MAEITITEKNFEQEVVQSDKPVLIDFWASWCGPCKMLAPVIAQIAQEYEGQVKVGKVNIDQEPELARKFRIVSIPTVILFKEGEAAATSIGLVPKEQLVGLLEK